MEGHFKWRCMEPDLAPGMKGGGGREAVGGEGWEEIAKRKTHARSSVLLHLAYNGGKSQAVVLRGSLVWIFLSSSYCPCILMYFARPFVWLFAQSCDTDNLAIKARKTVP